jgi:hypothetical protein
MRAKSVWFIWSIGVAFFAGFGLWAFVDPASFYDVLAEFPPYNRHFLRDAGAFQIGIGTALTAGAFRTDGMLAGLAGAAVAAVLHALSHVIDRDLGGRGTDHVFLWALAAALVLATVAQASRRQT